MLFTAIGIGCDRLGRTGFESPVTFLDDVVADAIDLFIVSDRFDSRFKKLVERSDEVAFARPQVLRQCQGCQQRVRGQLPDGEDGQQVSVKVEDFKGVKLLEGDVVDVGQNVVLEVEFAEMNQAGKFVAVKLSNVILVQVKLAKVGQSGEGIVADRDDVAVVQEQLLDSVTSKEVLLVNVLKIVAVKVKGSRVHGDQDWDVAVIVAGASDNVQGPVGVVLALAAERTLHPAITSVKVATHAAGEAVGLVFAQEVFFGHVDDEGSFDGLINVVIVAVVVDADEL